MTKTTFAVAALLLTACPARNAAPATKPAAEGPPIKRVEAKANPATQKPAGPGVIAVEHATAWLKAYMELGEALVHSDPTRASQHASSLITHAPPEALRPLIASFPTDLKGQRLRFAKMSAEVHTLWKASAELQANTAVMHCPMVPADWIQPAGELRNPYMPETMLRCGYQVLPEP